MARTKRRLAEDRKAEDAGLHEDVGRLLMRMRDEPRFFIETCLMVKEIGGGGVIPFAMNPGQLLVMDAVERQMRQGRPVRVAVLKSRRQGITTLGQALIYWATSTRRHMNGMVVAHKDEKAREIFRIAKWFYDSDKRHALGFAPELEASNERALRFANPDKRTRHERPGLMSSLLVESAEGNSAGHGDTLHAVHLSEVGRYEGKNASEVMGGVGIALSKAAGTIGIMESTARGRTGLWYEICDRAMRGRGEWEFVFLPWSLDPNNSHKLGPGERENWEWRSREERDMAEKFGLTLAQLKWRRIMLDSPDMQRPGVPAEVVFREQYPLCVAGPCRISTPDGIIRIDSAEHIRWVESGEVARWTPSGERDTVCVTTEKGYEIVCTPDHPIALLADGFEDAERTVGHKVKLCPPMFAERKFRVEWNPLPFVTSSFTVDEDWGLFLGYFMGDGSWTKGSLSVVASARDHDVCIEIERLVKKLTATHAVARLTGKNKMCHESRAGSTAFRNVMHLIGAIKTDGHGYWARNVCVPEVIFRSPRKVVRAFLSGLFESDGWSSATSNVIRLASIHRDMLRDVQLLLLGFGITCRIHERTRRSSNGKWYPIWYLDLGSEASIRFHGEIGFRSARKRNSNGRSKSGRPPTAIVMADTVARVEPAGKQAVYDLTVPSVRVFGANGILVHNCPEEAFAGSGATFFLMEPLRKMEEAEKREPTAKGELSTPIALSRRADDDWTSVRPAWKENGFGPALVWEPPVPGEDYVVAADIAEGTSDGDASVAVVLRRSNLDYVARVKAQKMDPDLFGEMCCLLGWHYNTAIVAIERNGPGIAALTAARRAHYTRLYADASKSAERPEQRFGWRTTPGNRRFILDALEGELREGNIHIHSRDFFEEAGSIVLRETNTGFVRPEAAIGKHDDEVMALAIALQVHARSGAAWKDPPKREEEFSHPMLHPLSAKKKTQTSGWW